MPAEEDSAVVVRDEVAAREAEEATANSGERADAAPGEHLVSDEAASTNPTSIPDSRHASVAAGGDETTGSPPTERFLLFADGQPLIVEVQLTIDGRPYTEPLQRLTDQVLEAADADGDGQATWREIAASKRFIYGQFGNVPINGPEEVQNLMRIYDANGDGRVDRSEVPRFLTRNAGGSQAFSLQSSNFYRRLNRIDSPIGRLLDRDENGLIDQAELANVATVLFSRDTDNDGVLQTAEFAPISAAMLTQPRTMRRRNEPDAAKLLYTGTNWNTIQYSLEELYASGGVLTERSASLPSRWFAECDSDQDGELNADELRGLEKLSPDIALTVRFGRDEQGQPAPPSIGLRHLGPEFERRDAPNSSSERRITVASPTEEIVFEINDAALSDDFAAQAEAQLARFDTDANGYVDREEAAAMEGFAGPFDGVDSNEDEMVVAGEIAEFLAGQQAAIRSQIRARASYREDVLFTALDANADGRLGTREIVGAAARLLSFDRDGDGFVHVNEVPGSMIVVFARGNPQQGDALFTPNTSMPSQLDDEVPNWFLRMDANRDGDISPREFLGNQQQFDDLDTNRDGFISAIEIRATFAGESEPDE